MVAALSEVPFDVDADDGFRPGASEVLSFIAGLGACLCFAAELVPFMSVVMAEGVALPVGIKGTME